MSKVRVLVVEDSLTVRRHLCEILSAEPGLEVVGEAGDGKTAIALCVSLRPDVITLDMMLPVMTGLAVTEYVMAHCPTPILIVSASVNRGELFRTYDALAAGALDCMDKPRGDATDSAWRERFVAAVHMAARIRVITHPRLRLGAIGAPPLASEPGGVKVVALGASTGGPGALCQVLSGIPAPCPVPILVVLHIGEIFGDSFAEWLDGQTQHRVRAATDGEPLGAAVGRVTVARPGRHMVVRGGRLRLTDAPPRSFCRPSVDALFDSLADEVGAGTLACLLTGMGKDGATGLLRVRQAGGLTVAQDEASSTVYGMPREAVALGAARRIVPLADIGRLVGDRIAGSRR